MFSNRIIVFLPFYTIIRQEHTKIYQNVCSYNVGIHYKSIYILEGIYMSEEKQTNEDVNTKPVLNTSPLGSDVIFETFAQKDISNTQNRNEGSSKED